MYVNQRRVLNIVTKYRNRFNTIFLQEWEALTDQIVMELKMEDAKLDDNILSSLGEDRAFEVFLLQVN